MGVKTRIWGPYAWTVFETIAVVVDYVLKYSRSKKIKQKAKKLFLKFVVLIGYILPCIHCRRSFKKFTNVKKPKVDIERFMTLQDGAKQIIYALHNRVNLKLKTQEIEKYKHDKRKLKDVLLKWDNHYITFEDALRLRFKSADHKHFWHSLVAFEGLIMCDFRSEDAEAIFQFFVIVSEILNLSSQSKVKKINNIYKHALVLTSEKWRNDMSFNDRMNIVWGIYKLVFGYNNWKLDHTFDTFRQRCKSSIVGC